MNKKELKKQLNKEIASLELPLVLPAVLNSSNSLYGEMPQRKSSATKKLVASALAFVFAIFGFASLFHFLTFDQTVYATITMDINPSIELKLNKAEQVLSIVAFNADGEDLIAQLNFKRIALTKVLDRLVQKAVEKNFITSEDWFLLVTIDLPNEQAKQTLQNKVQAKVIEVCNRKGIQAREDEIGFENPDQSQAGNAQNHGISPAKYAYIKHVYENTNNSFSTLEEFVVFMKDKSMVFIRQFAVQNAN